MRCHADDAVGYQTGNPGVPIGVEAEPMEPRPLALLVECIPLSELTSVTMEKRAVRRLKVSLTTNYCPSGA
jgi:hypothetical protein